MFQSNTRELTIGFVQYQFEMGILFCVASHPPAVVVYVIHFDGRTFRIINNANVIMSFTSDWEMMLVGIIYQSFLWYCTSIPNFGFLTISFSYKSSNMWSADEMG